MELGVEMVIEILIRILWDGNAEMEYFMFLKSSNYSFEILRKYKDGRIGNVEMEVLRWKIQWNLLKSSSHLTNPSQPLLLAG